MIVRRTFRPHKIIPYIWAEVTFTLVVAVSVYFLAVELGRRELVVPFGPLGVLGTALAIFLGFRANQSYARWWEARILWSSITSQCRILARQIITAADNAHALGKGGGAEAVAAFKREMVYRLIAFAHALRIHLRGQEDPDAVRPLIPPAELERLARAANRPNLLLQIQSDRLKYAVRAEVFGPFDPISIEPNLVALNNWQGGCERIKQTPMPRQYDFFTRLFLWVFFLLLPSSLIGLFAPGAASWPMIPLAGLIALVYATVNRAGQVIEDPFENKEQDVPMTALCIAIERDLREQLGETDLPPAAVAVDGFLM